MHGRLELSVSIVSVVNCVCILGHYQPSNKSGYWIDFHVLYVGILEKHRELQSITTPNAISATCCVYPLHLAQLIYIPYMYAIVDLMTAF